MDIDVRQIHMPEMIVASLRRVLASYGDEGVLWQEIGPLMAASGVGMPDHGEGIGVSGIRCRCRCRSMAPGSVLVHARRSPRVPHHSPVRGRSRNAAGQLRGHARSHRRSGHPHRGEWLERRPDVQHLPGEPGTEPRSVDMGDRRLLPHNRLMNLLSYRNAHSFPHPSRLRVFAESVTYNTPIDYAASGQPVAGMPPLHCTCRPPHRFTASKARQFNRRCRSVDRATRISTRNAPPLSTPIIKFR